MVYLPLFLLRLGQNDNIYMVEQEFLYFFSLTGIQEKLFKEKNFTLSYEVSEP